MRHFRAVLASLVLAAGLLTSIAVGSPAQADECYSWMRTLSAGASGADVAELQVRVAGWAGYGVVMGIDGSYGPQTQTAVRSFQSAYGLAADGVAGPATFAKIYGLPDADCSPAHFDWAEALRHRMGDRPLRVTSGFRSTS